MRIYTVTWLSLNKEHAVHMTIHYSDWNMNLHVYLTKVDEAWNIGHCNWRGGGYGV